MNLSKYKQFDKSSKIKKTKTSFFKKMYFGYMLVSNKILHYNYCIKCHKIFESTSYTQDTPNKCTYCKYKYV